MAPELLIQCLRKVHSGEIWLEKRSTGYALAKLLRQEAGTQQIAKVLTSREIELVRLVASGFDNTAIATKLHISENTVKVHLHHIYEKLQVKNRVALTLYAQEKGLV
jgi:DNA-binding NarL/FixJ family response regulator